MKKFFKRLSGIFCVITVVAFFIWYFIENCKDVDLSEDKYFLVSFYYVVILIFIFSSMWVAYNFSFNSDKVKIKRFHIFKELKILEQSNELMLFEKYCVKKNNDKIIKDLEDNIKSFPVSEFINIVEKGNKKDKEVFLDNYKFKERKLIKFAMLKYNTSSRDECFIQFYNNEILSKKNTAFSFLINFISIILSIIPFFIEQFKTLSLETYIEFLPLVVCMIADSIFSYKENTNNLADEYQTELIELRAEIDEFLNNKNSLQEENQ